jgi:hypothetical protein
MSHLTSELVNDGVACCRFYGTLLSVSLMSQILIGSCLFSLWIYLCCCEDIVCFRFENIVVAYFNLLFTGDLAAHDLKNHIMSNFTIFSQLCFFL